MKRILLLFAFTASVASAGPLDKAWIKGTTDKDPLSYAPGEEMVFTLEPMGIDGDFPVGEYQLDWKLSDDFGRRDGGRVPFTAAPFVLRTSLDCPGFVRLEAYVVDADGKRYEQKYVGDTTTPEGRKAMNEFEKKPHHVFFDGGAAVNPDALEPTPEPADFDAFWAGQFARLDLVPIKADLVETDSPNANVRRWAVRIDCAGLRPVTGYLSIPKSADEGRKFRAHLETHGYNGNSFSPNKPGWVSGDAIVLNINAHGLKLPEFGATEADRKALRWEVRSHDKDYAFDPAQNEDPETAYFNGMVLRVKRALQYLKTLDCWDGTNLVAAGGSQGGLQTLWAAGCGEGVTLAKPGIPWCCDMAVNASRGERGAAGNWWYVPWTDSMGYYDAVNFAKRIPASCRVEVTRAGLGDYTCPPMGIAKLWNAIHPGNKSIRWVQGSTHGHTPPEYEGRDTIREEPASVPPIILLEPAEGAVVPLLNETQRAYVLMSREERVNAYTNEAFRRALRDGGEVPAKVRFAWKGTAPEGEGPAFTVEVRRKPDGKVFFRGETDRHHLAADGCFEIAREWEWTVRARGGASATGTFRTEDLAPRLIDGGAVPNVRDLGGRVGLGGRRVRQGLVYRSAGLNSNASDVFYTREELLAEAADPAALLAQEAALSNEVVRLRAELAGSARLELVSGELPPQWALFRPAQAAFDADGGAALAALREIPATFCGAPAETLSKNENGDWYIHGRAKAVGPAVLFAVVDASDDGWLSLGCGADWFWTLYVNGEPVFDRREGNDRKPIGADNFAFPVRVRKGPNLLAVVLKPGSGGWRWCCQTSPAVPVATLLQTLADNAQYRLDRLFRVRKCRQPGTTRINDENRDRWLGTLGVKTDVDLRSEGEVYGMEGSPLGPTVAWVNVSSSAYGGMQEEGGRKAFAKVFRVFLDPANYPIDFHCIAGQDRTGAVGFILNALLGVEEEELWLDWEVTAFHNRSTDFNHEKLFDKLVRGFDRWPGETINERVEAYVLDLGFTPEEIAAFRDIMLEPAPNP